MKQPLSISNKGEDSLYTGVGGESLVDALLARFFAIGHPKPDIGIDHAGHLKEPEFAGVTFNFQTKLRQSVRANSKTVARWVELVPREPVVIFWVRRASLLSQCYGFLTLHDWMLDHVDWPDLLTQPRVAFPRRDFTEIDSDGTNFHAAMIDEAHRVLKLGISKWETAVPGRLLLTENELFRRLGNLANFEIPKNVFDDARQLSGAINDARVVGFLSNLWTMPEEERNAARQTPAIKVWWADIMRQAEEGATERERNEFRQFIQAMRSYDLAPNGFYMPSFRYKQISLWRVFCQMFPQSYRLLERVLNHPEYWNTFQLMGALQLLSTLATTNGVALKESARDLILRWQDRLATHQDNRPDIHMITRQWLYSKAEATSDRKAEKAFIDYVWKAGIQSDFRLNQAYYETRTDNSLLLSTRRKLEMPKVRDVNTKSISLFFLNELTSGEAKLE